MSCKPFVLEKCTHQLWEGVECELAAGHKGPHHRSACEHGAALSWRSSPPPIRQSAPQLQPAMFKLATLAH
jgi:hypothetical protein